MLSELHIPRVKQGQVSRVRQPRRVKRDCRLPTLLRCWAKSQRPTIKLYKPTLEWIILTSDTLAVRRAGPAACWAELEALITLLNTAGLANMELKCMTSERID